MLREDEIRADRLRAGQLAAMEHDIAWLEARVASFVEVPCPACGADARVETFHKRPHAYHTCSKCSTVYVSPRPSDALLGEFYAQSENYAYWNAHVFPASEAQRRAHIFAPRAERVRALAERHLGASQGQRLGALVEVGAGFGTFGECVRALDVFERVVVLEPTPDLAATCRARGLEVIEAPVEVADLGGLQADVLASFEVIEHLYDPAGFLARCVQWVRPGGILLLTCPSATGFDVAVLREASDTVDHEHINYFTPASLTRLVESHGFTVLETLTPGQLDVELVRKKVLAGAFAFGSSGAEQALERLVMDPAAGDALQRLLAERGGSSHLWLVARRVGPPTSRLAEV